MANSVDIDQTAHKEQSHLWLSVCSDLSVRVLKNLYGSLGINSITTKKQITTKKADSKIFVCNISKHV